MQDAKSPSTPFGDGVVAGPFSALVRSGYMRSLADRGADALVAVRPYLQRIRYFPLAFMVLAYVVRFATLSVNVLHGYGQPAFDMGIPDQGIWLLSRFHNPFVTVMGRQLFGDHSSYVYLLLVPLFWVYPHTAALLVVQAMLLAGGAIPIYALARHLLRSDLLATMAAAAYLLNPALQQGNMEQFHVECFEVSSLATAIYAAVVWKPRLLLGAVLVLLLCKEDAAVYAVPMAVWIFLRRDRDVGVIVAVLAVVAALIDNVIVIPALIGVASAHGGRFPFGGLKGSIREIVRYPGQAWSYAVSAKRPWYLWQLGFSSGLTFARAPEVALIAIGGVTINIWSNFGYQHQIFYHYSLPLVPILACGSVWAISRLASPRRRLEVTSVLLLSALWACTIWGLAPFSNEKFPYISPASQDVHEINQIVRAVPPNAVVSAFYDFVPQLDHRTQIYMWPDPFVASYWGNLKEEGKPLPFAYKVQYVILPVSIYTTDSNWAHVSSQFHVVLSNSEAALFERNSSG